MNLKLPTIMFLGAFCTSVAFAGDVITAESGNKTTSTNTSTIGASTMLSPGSYMATVSPSFDKGMARRLKKALQAVAGTEGSSANAEDSSVHFKVKDGSKVRVADIENAVAKAQPDAVITTPILETSLTIVP